MRDDSSNLAGDHLVAQRSHDVMGFVDFDLSVVVRSQATGEVSAGLEVFGLEIAGGKVDGWIDHTRVQHLKFQIPLKLSFDLAQRQSAAIP